MDQCFGQNKRLWKKKGIWRRNTRRYAFNIEDYHGTISFFPHLTVFDISSVFIFRDSCIPVFRDLETDGLFKVEAGNIDSDSWLLIRL